MELSNTLNRSYSSFLHKFRIWVWVWIGVISEITCHAAERLGPLTIVSAILFSFFKKEWILSTNLIPFNTLPILLYIWTEQYTYFRCMRIITSALIAIHHTSLKASNFHMYKHTHFTKLIFSRQWLSVIPTIWY